MDFKEFQAMVRYVEPNYFKIHRKYLRGIFDQYSIQSEISHERILTSEIFEKLCQEKFLFNQASFERFFNSGSLKGLCKNYQELITKWEPIKVLLKGNIRFFEEDTLQQMLTKVSSLIAKTDRDPNKIWLNYKLLELEVNRQHCETFIGNLLPDELIELEDCLCKLEDKSTVYTLPGYSKMTIN
jgi:hypothetical protein